MTIKSADQQRIHFTVIKFYSTNTFLQEAAEALNLVISTNEQLHPVALCVCVCVCVCIVVIQRDFSVSLYIGMSVC